MHVYVFGNPDLDMDALPLRLTPALEQAFPEVTFTTLDPNEDWDVPAHMVLIDTVVGIDTVTTFRDLAVFEKAPRVTCHDFDAYANLLLLKKLGKLQEVTIVGVPAGASEDVLPSVAEQLRTVLSNEY